mgnify:FL=1
MVFFQLPSPDLSNLSLGGAVLRLLEASGFTADEKDLLVRGTYTDDGDPLFGLHYGVWLFNVDSSEYTVNFNELIAGETNAREIDVIQIQTSGNADNLFAIALVETKGTNETRLVSIQNNQVISNNLVHSIYGEELDIKVEDFLLSDNGRFLAIQTSSEQLAAEDAPDTNDSSDIYLVDLHNNSVTRVSYVGESEVTEPTYLKDIDIDGNTVRIAFTTDAAFVSPSKTDLNSAIINSQVNHRSDAYLWSSAFDSNGLTGDFLFELISKDIDGKASGFVDRDNNINIIDQGAVFTSSSEYIAENDINESSDSFYVDEQGNLQRLILENNNELDSGSIFLSASDDGRFVGYLTVSPEISGSSGAQQLVVYDRQLDTTKVVSENGSMANNWVTGGVLSPTGQAVAFTSAADNLSEDSSVATAGNLYLSISENIVPEAKNLDFDDNGEVDALTDGLMLLRYLFELRGNNLIEGAVSDNANRTTSEEIEQYIASNEAADIDQNGEVDALTDGLLLLRYLFALRGNNLVEGAIGDNANRTTSVEIEEYILSKTPVDLLNQDQQASLVIDNRENFSKTTNDYFNASKKSQNSYDDLKNSLLQEITADSELAELLNFSSPELPSSQIFDGIEAKADLAAINLKNSMPEELEITIDNGFIV